MSTLEAETLITWLESGFADNGAKLKLLFTTMPSGTAAKHATLHDIENKIIPQSILFDFQICFADTNSKLSNTMCSRSQFQSQAQKLNLHNDDTLVVYDNYGNFCASRVWFMCKAMGFENVYLLNGGLPRWASLGYPMVSGNSLDILDSPGSKNERLKLNHLGTFEAKPNKGFIFVDKRYIQDVMSQRLLGNKNECILDARGNARFFGDSADPRANVKNGHIPTSLNLHYADLQDEWGGFLPLDQLQEKFKLLAPESKQFVFSCGSGVTACILAQAAHLLNFSPLLVYDGSWSEWGADNELPRAMGPV